MSERDALAREVADLLAEWRKTCGLMGMRWTDRDAGAFVADAIGHRVTPPAEHRDERADS